MSRKHFKSAVARDDKRLKEPHIAIHVYWKDDEPKIMVIGRGKSIKNKAGEFIRTEFWYDLPGGKAEPIYDEAMLKAGVPPEKCKIVDVEAGHVAATNEAEQEIRAYLQIGEKIDEANHPGQPGLVRHFYIASAEDRQIVRMKNMVPNEHYFTFETDTENAIALLSERITDKVRDCIRNEADKLWDRHTQPAPEQMACRAA